MKGTQRNQRGSALVLALIVVTVVATLSMALLNLNQAVTKRQQHSVDDMRAFYLAEAGLSEAYLGLGGGKSGQIGSEERPALCGDGMVWVDAIPLESGLLRLRSTGLCQAGRATLEVVVAREEQPLGIFADERIELTTPFLLDGYDSGTSDYFEQVASGSITVDPTYEYLYVDTTHNLLFYEEIFYHFTAVDGHTYAVDHAFDFRAHLDMGFDWDDFVDGDDWGDIEHKLVVEYFMSVSDNRVAVAGDSNAFASGRGHRSPSEPFSQTATTSGPTTGVGGMLGSNGPISLSASGGSVEVFGDVVTGPGETVDLDWGVLVTGRTDARDEPLELNSVVPPEVDMLPGFVHGSAIPKILPPSDIGYESITIEPGAELVVQGTGNLVVGDLDLLPDGFIHVENEAGGVNVYVTGSAQLAQGSVVRVDSRKAGALSLQGTDTAASLSLKASSQFNGMVYAPDSHVAVGVDFEIFGGLVANTFELDPNTRLHFDSGVLDDSGAVPLPRLVSWRLEQVPSSVAQSRVDPFRLYQVDESELDSITDAQETTSWFYEVEYWGHDGKRVTYKGPYEQWDPSVVASRVGIPEWTPPTAQLAGEWTIWISYQDLLGRPREFNGAMTDFTMTVAAARVFDVVVTPPPGVY